ncbi:MAG: porin family protein [Ferruginibacter sp.]
MKYAMVFILLFVAANAVAQTGQSNKKKHPVGFGIKAGYNYTSVTNISSVNGSNRSGFHAGILYSPGTRDEANLTGSGELLFSRQGYSFKTSATTGKVNLDYLLLPTFTNFKFGDFFKLQLGLQAAYLLNAKADSSKPATSSNTYNKMVEYYNRFEFGISGGLELNPAAGFIIGVRYTIGLTNMNKQTPPGAIPPFLPGLSNINFRNNIVQLYTGYKF